jgi:hypothetical protein
MWTVGDDTDNVEHYKTKNPLTRSTHFSVSTAYSTLTANSFLDGRASGRTSCQVPTRLISFATPELLNDNRPDSLNNTHPRQRDLS